MKLSRDLNFLLVGGGSGGPTVPLFAVASELKKFVTPKSKLFLAGLRNGVEKKLADSYGLEFIEFRGGAKLRRYWSFHHLILPIRLCWDFLYAIKVLREKHISCVVGAGSFLQVPVMWAAYLLKIPIFCHQQDVVPTLANRLCSRIASRITVSLKESVSDFSPKLTLGELADYSKVKWTGNPVRSELLVSNREKALQIFGFTEEKPVLLCMGGGGGAAFINELVLGALPELLNHTQVLHITGRSKGHSIVKRGYVQRDFVIEMPQAYSVASVVLSRAGFSTLSELANLRKPSICVPIPHSHQEANARLLEANQAALVFTQDDLTPEILNEVVRSFWHEPKLANRLSTNLAKLLPSSGAEEVSKTIIGILAKMKVD